MAKTMNVHRSTISDRKLIASETDLGSRWVIGQPFWQGNENTGCVCHHAHLTLGHIGANVWATTRHYIYIYIYTRELKLT